MIFEGEMRQADDEIAGEPRWKDMVAVLQDSGVAADERQLERLPFVVEISDDVRRAFSG
jgi:hypothetical protein